VTSKGLQIRGPGLGAMGDLLSHSIDLALMLNGALDQVSALIHTFTPRRVVDDAREVL
jgi:predicted dehydrogenase